MSLNCVTISLIYAVPSLTLYAVTVVIIILHWKNVKSSFYQFYIFEFIINTITFVNAMFSVKMPTATCAECTLHKYFQEQSVPSFMSQFQFVIQFNMAFVQYGLTTTVAINRMSIVLYPKFFEQLWRRHGWVVMGVIFIVPFFVTYHIFLYDTYFQYNAVADKFSLASKYNIKDIFTTLSCFMVSCTVVTMISNFISYLKIRTFPFKPKNLEYNFFIVTALASAIQVLGTILTLAMKSAASDSTTYKVTNTALPYVSDALSLIQPTLLIIFCKGIRKHVAHLMVNICMLHNCLIPASMSRLDVASNT
ncbi:Serpentine receptor class gamma [Caenorhabditis elegans]|uniref:Serpentine receptor class gamma n=1 Tax=Caenorhabditis elegans TaxID=6239 RepID=Q86GC0_CAEEL|nr:Serpentine receptor class gamma [Caenorhabditis elegans]CAD60423.1 Serpentine receptor class gamma [Caenorhabditis elegans]|eukprot:NP_872228.1 Serpentine receptor class gamma [Caenorhabditis elegans]